MVAPIHNTYGLDIEINAGDGVVDPVTAAVTKIAVSAGRSDVAFVGSETEILRGVNDYLNTLAPGVLATWNGSIFDLPFIADRARIVGIELDLVLVADPNGRMGRQPLPGHRGSHKARWGEHRHLDTYRLHGSHGSGWGHLVGRARRQSQAVNTNDLLNEALHANAVNDARLARVLAERRGVAALRVLDRIEDLELAQPVDFRSASPRVLRPSHAAF